MRKITIYPRTFFNMKKSQAMKTYSLTEYEYQYIHSMGMVKDEGGNVMDSYEVTIPDSNDFGVDKLPQTTTEGSAIQQESPTKLPQAIPQPNQVKQKNVNSVPHPVYNQPMQGSVPQSVQYYAPQPMCNQQQLNLQMAHDCMEQSRKFLDIAVIRMQNGCSNEEYAFYIQRSHEEEDMARYYYSLACNPVWNEAFSSVTTNSNNTNVTTQTKTINNPLSNLLLGINAAHQAVDTFDKAVNVFKGIKDLFGGDNKKNDTN